MAKAAIPKNTAAAPAPAAATPYAIVDADAPPPAATFGGGRRGEDSPIKKTMLSLAAPANGKYKMFTVPVSAPDGITDPAEKAKALAERLRKEVAKVSGVARRVTKADASAHFTVRGVTKDDGSGAEVRVWRIEPKPAPAPAA